MLDRQQDQVEHGQDSSLPYLVGEDPTNPPAQEETKLPTPAVPFRLIADFTVGAETAAKYLKRPGVTREERDLFLFILTTPEALNRMCRLAIVCDFEAFLTDRYFEGKFSGPTPTDILDSVLPYLPAELQTWWTELRSWNCNEFSSRIDGIFQEFCSSLTRTAIQDMSTGEPITLECRPPDSTERGSSADR